MLFPLPLPTMVRISPLSASCFGLSPEYCNRKWPGLLDSLCTHACPQWEGPLWVTATSQPASVKSQLCKRRGPPFATMAGSFLYVLGASGFISDRAGRHLPLQKHHLPCLLPHILNLTFIPPVLFLFLLILAVRVLIEVDGGLHWEVLQQLLALAVQVVEGLGLWPEKSGGKTGLRNTSSLASSW